MSLLLGELCNSCYYPSLVLLVAPPTIHSYWTQQRHPYKGKFLGMCLRTAAVDPGESPLTPPVGVETPHSTG